MACSRAWARVIASSDRAPWRSLDVSAIAATAVTASCPLFWYLAVRPMSDLPGLAIALMSQACLLLAWWRQRPERMAMGG